MKRYLRLYKLFIKYSLIRAMAYRQEFITWLLVNIGWLTLNIVFYELLFLNVTQIAGWEKADVLVLVGFYFIFDFILWGVLGPNARSIPRKINSGNMDFDLTKPINTQFLLSLKEINIHQLSSLLLGVFIIIYAVNLGEIPLTIINVLLSLLTLIIASIFVYSGWFSTMCIAFWFDRIDNLHFLFPGLRQFWKVPQPFYKGLFRIILTFILPITLVTTVPTQLIIQKFDLTLVLTLAVFAALSFIISTKVFKIAINHYSSASS